MYHYYGMYHHCRLTTNSHKYHTILHIIALVAAQSD